MNTEKELQRYKDVMMKKLTQLNSRNERILD